MEHAEKADDGTASSIQESTAYNYLSTTAALFADPERSPRHFVLDMEQIRSNNTSKASVRPSTPSETMSWSVPDDEPKPWRPDEPFRYPPPKRKDQYGRSYGPFDVLWQAVKKHDEEMCRGLTEDCIDTLLVFAGLLCAVVTSFTVDSYQLLKRDSTDQTNVLLLRISQQLENSSVSAATDPDRTPFTASTAAVRVNTFWFLSIILSLSAALIGILAKQWIREYQTTVSESGEDALQRRQLRYEALEQWKVPQIIYSLPVLIEFSVISFFAGLLDYLWALNTVVAVICTVAIGLILAFVTLTTILPIIFNPAGFPHFVKPPLLPCPYRSPQVHASKVLSGLVFWNAFEFLMAVKSLSRKALWAAIPSLFKNQPPSKKDDSASDNQAAYTTHHLEKRLVQNHKSQFMRNCLRWIRDRLIDDPYMANHFFLAVQSTDRQTRADYHLCDDHPHLKVNTFTSAQLDMLDRSFAVELCIRSLYLGSCPNCMAGDEMADPYEKLQYLLTMADDELPSDLYIQSYLAVKDGLTSGKLAPGNFGNAWKIISFLWSQECPLGATRDAVSKHILNAFQEWITKNQEDKAKLTRGLEEFTETFIKTKYHLSPDHLEDFAKLVHDMEQNMVQYEIGRPLHWPEFLVTLGEWMSLQEAYFGPQFERPAPIPVRPQVVTDSMNWASPRSSTEL